MLGRGLIAVVSLGLSSALPGCAIDSAGLRVSPSDDGGAGDPDAATERDAEPRSDTGSQLDASEPPDAGRPADGGEPADTGSCEPATEICNALDDDCDGETDETCPCDVVAAGGSVYLFCTEQERWDDARAGCRAVAGFDLVIIGSAAEDGLVWGEANARAGSPFWIGLYEPLPGVYHWVDGTEVWNGISTGAYNNFAGGSPEYSVPNDCGQLDPAEGGAWTEGHCHDDDLPYVCERL